MNSRPGKPYKLFFIGAITFTLLFLSSFNPALAGFANSKQITIQASQVDGASDLINFAVMIKITGSQFQEIEDDVGANGYDIEFRAADQTTRLTHEIEVYDEANDILVAWVKIPSLSASSNTIIHIFYGDASITTPTDNPPGVWNTAFKAVWHLKENPGTAGAGGIKDSTAYSNHGTDQGGMNSGNQVDGMAGKALFFDGADDFLSIPHHSSIDFGDENLTVSFWIKGQPSDVPDGDRLLMKGTSSGGCGGGKRYSIYASGDTLFKFAVDDDVTKTQLSFTKSQILDDSWHYATFVRDADNDIIKVYVDGSLSTQLGCGTHNISNGCDLYIAANHDNAEKARIAYDEFRILNIANPNTWIKTEFNNQNSPATFYIIGSENDSEPPAVTITSPTNDPTYSTNTDTISLAGTASDNIAVTQVNWTNSTGGSGVCSGLGAWNANITLAEGDNIITVAARDAIGNIATDVITVTYDPNLPDPPPPPDPNLPQCAASIYTDYHTGFTAADLDLITVAEVDGNLVLQTGSQAIDPENIVIPFEQEIRVTYLHSGSGHDNDFGWLLKDDAVDASGNFKGYLNIPVEKKHGIFRDIRDGDPGTGVPADGILDVFEGEAEADVANYDDDTDYPFIVDGDNVITPKDHKKFLGVFAGGTEIVFFVAGYDGIFGSDVDFDDPAVDPDWIFYSKRDWSSDVYDKCDPGDSSFNKLYNLDQVRADPSPCSVDDGWLEESSIDRLSTYFGVTLSGTYAMPITVGQKYPHAIVGAPAADPNQWVFGFEDVHSQKFGWSDMDHNDIVIHVERRTGGAVQLKASQAITPPSAGSFFTAVTLSVYDKIMDGACLGQNTIKYYLSIDAGANWVEITSWDRIMDFTLDGGGNPILGNDVADWTPGIPELTYRTRRVDFAGLGISGRDLIWKAEMTSDDDQCVPEIVDLVLEANVAGHGTFSRSSPISLANVLYSGSYETPAPSWTELTNRGHLNATRTYDPANPTATAEQQLWDAGQVLNVKAPSARTIYFPNMVVNQINNEDLATGDDSATTFSGTLAQQPVSATTLVITDQLDAFRDIHTTVLEGDLGGTGTINRATGEYTVTFNSPPGNNVPIHASYQYYTTASSLLPFTAANVTKDMLGLDDTEIIPHGKIYDLNNDNDVTAADAQWLINWVRGYSDGISTPKEWILGPIDHSTPAIATPPGLSRWYFGTATTAAERESFDTFMLTHQDRQSVIYVGALDGMLHAFDAGKFRHGDNEDTGIVEKRGYFLWEDRTADPPAYCSADPANCPNYGTGDELWAFIPANLLPRFKNNLLQGDDRAYVDASPALADVYIDGAWKTVLLSAEGIGGDTVFGLDVTNPASPAFLWEFSDPDLFRSRSSPAVSKIGRILVNDSARWVAFFVSGKSNDATLYPSIYMIDIADGSVIERIYLDSEASGIGGVPSGQPSILDTDGNGYLDRIYITTDKGLLYKVNIPDSPDAVAYGISDCVINKDFTDDNSTMVAVAQRFHPIYGSPLAIVDSDITPGGDIDYNIKIFFGTGDSPYYDDDINTAETSYHFFAYRDEMDKGECDENDAHLDWFVQLPPGHRIFASAFAAAGTVYFGTSVSETEDPCETPAADGSIGSIYAFDIAGSDVPKFEQSVGNTIVSPQVFDKHIYIKTQDGGLQSFGDGNYNSAKKMGGFPEVKLKYWREIF